MPLVLEGRLRARNDSRDIRVLSLGQRGLSEAVSLFLSALFPAFFLEPPLLRTSELLLTL